MPYYCPTTGQSTLTNANTPVPNQVVNTTTSFTCNSGYQSSGGATAPYYTCNPSSTAAGVWSAVSNTCDRMLYVLLVLITNHFLFKWQLLCCIV